MGATRQERAELYGQFTKTDNFIAHATSTVTHVDAIEAVSMPEPGWLWRGDIELYAGAEE
jgi:hypothetical protein